MATEHTQQQSTEDQRRAKELSLKSTTPPIEVPGYETQKFLGSGAFGEVWVGVDQTTGRRVAIKFYTHRGGVDWTLLSREVEKLAVLSADRYVVQLLDVGWDSDPPYYVMDYIDNGSLEDLLKREGVLPANQAIEIFQEVAVGLMHLHGKGVLHCDLKPANVLLDEDNKPRLADFGQSRLSHEQKPALGTLFYMAPEQADLEAVPDSRWDVYALGALLYCMLTGGPPFRTNELMSEIDSATSLSDRLALYRQAIQSAPRPTGHRQVSGIDRALIDIIDRCLATDPRDRLPSVQSVLEALTARDDARVRNPLLLLGVLAPVLFLIIMVYFGWTNYHDAVDLAGAEQRNRVRKSNQFFAESVAHAIEAEIPRYFDVVDEESKRSDLLSKIQQVTTTEETNQMLARLSIPWSRWREMSDVRDQFLDHPLRLHLKQYLRERLDNRLAPLKAGSKNGLPDESRALKLASLFVTDRTGTILAVAYDDPTTPTNSVGKNYSYRSYFHGGPIDLAKTTQPSEVEPIEKRHLSDVFKSTTTRTWKVGFSTPIFSGNEFLGVMVLTVELGDFTPFRHHSDDHFAVLVDGRAGPSQGTILHHPFFRNLQPAQSGNVTENYSEPKFHVDLNQFNASSGELLSYRDPLGQASGGQAYTGKWIATMEWVRLPFDDDREDTRRDSEANIRLAVIVQESFEETVKPIQNLGQSLLNRATMTIVLFVLVVCVQWYFVVRMLGGLRTTPGRYAADRATANSLHSMETVAAPEPPRQA